MSLRLDLNHVPNQFNSALIQFEAVTLTALLSLEQFEATNVTPDWMVDSVKTQLSATTSSGGLTLESWQMVWSALDASAAFEIVERENQSQSLSQLVAEGLLSCDPSGWDLLRSDFPPSFNTAIDTECTLRTTCWRHFVSVVNRLGNNSEWPDRVQSIRTCLKEVIGCSAEQCGTHFMPGRRAEIVAKGDNPVYFAFTEPLMNSGKILDCVFGSGFDPSTPKEEWGECITALFYYGAKIDDYSDRLYQWERPAVFLTCSDGTENFEQWVQGLDPRKLNTESDPESLRLGVLVFPLKSEPIDNNAYVPTIAEAFQHRVDRTEFIPAASGAACGTTRDGLNEVTVGRCHLRSLRPLLAGRPRVLASSL